MSLGLSFEHDKAEGRIYDTLEDCVMEIEELKNELAMIIMTQTTTGRERWDTPEIKVASGKKDRLRKDRYSALIMANMSARRLLFAKPPIQYESTGGFAQSSGFNRDDGPLYHGPQWWTQKMHDIY